MSWFNFKDLEIDKPIWILRTPKVYHCRMCFKILNKGEEVWFLHGNLFCKKCVKKHLIAIAGKKEGNELLDQIEKGEKE